VLEEEVLLMIFKFASTGVNEHIIEALWNTIACGAAVGGSVLGSKAEGILLSSV
jgi:hypothetical protein